MKIVIDMPEKTKEQIIALTNLGESFPPKLQERIVRAIINGTSLDMAIESLKQEPSGDLISREDIEECKELMTDINGDTVYAVRMSDIRQLSSVKPQEPKVNVVSEEVYTREYNLRKDAEFKAYKLEKALEQKQNGWEEMTVPCNHCGKDVTFKIATVGEPCEDCKYKSMAEQEPKTGHWIRRNAFLVPWKCSECNYESERYDNYCPYCGAKMESEEKENDT